MPAPRRSPATSAGARRTMSSAAPTRRSTAGSARSRSSTSAALATPTAASPGARSRSSWAVSHCRLGAVKPPFRADHVGSLLRPAELKAARDKYKNKSISRQDLEQIEERSIRKAVAMQEAAGLQAGTDGEFRRAFWHVDFLTGFEGIVATQGQYALKFHGEGGAESETRSMMVVTGKVKRSKPVMVEHFSFLKANTGRTAKLCIPAPTYMHMRGGRRVVAASAYPDIEEFWSDIARAYQEEIA